jgi:hypothetical protein
MKPKVSFSRPNDPATGLYSETENSSPYPHNLLCAIFQTTPSVEARDNNCKALVSSGSGNVIQRP